MKTTVVVAGEAFLVVVVLLGVAVMAIEDPIEVGVALDAEEAEADMVSTRIIDQRFHVVFVLFPRLLFQNSRA